MSARPGSVLRWLFRLPAWLYRWRCGWLLGHRFLLLAHVGRRTGRRHATVLEVLEYREPAREAVVMSGFGHRANWLRNIDARPGYAITIGRCRFIAAHRRLMTAEAITVIANYERRHRLAAPVVRLVLSRLLGWPYRGRQGERERLTAQLPLVAFRPLA